jgi:TP901 family phage tail tape measure protein
VASNAKLIRIIVRMEDQLTSGMNKAASAVEKSGRRIRNVGAGMTAAITAPAIAGAAGALKAYTSFEDKMVEIQARTQATAEDMEKMRQMALKMGADTVFSATQSAEALLELTSSGNSAHESMVALEHVLNLAAAGNLELGRSADGVTDVLKMFSLAIEDSEHVVNQLTKAAGSSSATVEQMLQGFENVGPVAAQMGMDVEQTAAALALFAENGIKGSEAGTSLRSMLLAMTRDTAKTKSAWNELGVSLYDAQGNMRDLDTVFKEINRAMEGMSMEDQNRIARQLAGSYGILGFNSLRAANGISDMQAKMMGASDAATVADARMNTLSGKFISLMGSIETLGITLGGLSEGPLVGLLDMSIKIVNALTRFAENNPRIAQTVIILIAIAAALGPILMLVGQIMTVWPALVAAFTAIGPILAALTGPIGVLVAALTVLIVLLMTKGPQAWETLKQLGVIIQWVGMKVAQHGAAIVRTIAGIVKRLADAFQGDTLKERIQNLGAELNKIMYEVMVAIGKRLTDGLIEGVKAKQKQFVEALNQLAQKAQAAVRNAFKIRSPSKVMMKMGAQVTEGFRRGVDGGGGIGVGVPNAPAMMKAVQPVMANGGGVNINIGTLSVPPGTTDEQVEVLLREIGKRIRRRGAMGGI